jgi:fructose-1,6-bisphosphatase-3
MQKYSEQELANDLEYLELLSESFGTVAAASAEIINLNAILNLPKGTEHFITDIHGEYEAFNHVLRNGSGVIKQKLIALFSDSMTRQEIDDLAVLIYYPREKLALIKQQKTDLDDWYAETLHRLIETARVAASKYTRSKVRKALPEDFAYIINELLNQDDINGNKKEYYQQIIKSIIRLGRADDFIASISMLIHRLTIDHLHIIGDIYDRGPGSHIVMDALMRHHSVDIQWGNHDILWMGAAAGNAACVANVVRICLRYGHIDILEDGYGINLRRLAVFAGETYSDRAMEHFAPHITKEIPDTEQVLLSKMHKAIAVIQFKVESALIQAHPEYGMDNRRILDTYRDGYVSVDGRQYPMNDTDLPTVDPKDPVRLTREEEAIIQGLVQCFTKSAALKRHAQFLFSKGSVYLKYNGNLLFHASIPMNPDGTFKEITLEGKRLKGEALLSEIDRLTRESYYRSGDFMWYLWCSPDSPLFGKDKMATFERYFLDDPETHVEEYAPYFHLIDDRSVAERVLLEFGLDPQSSHIINGHVPVRYKDGENPVKAEGKVIMIDGGFSKAYHKKTGIAGYTLVYNSYGFMLISHEPFESVDKAIHEGVDIRSTAHLVQTMHKRKRVADTDIGKRLQAQCDKLEMLIAAYRSGLVKEKM